MDDFAELQLTPFPFSVVVLHTEEMLEKFCDAKNFKDRRWVDDGSHAEVMNYGNIAAVRFNGLEALDVSKRVSVISHEATHVFQALCAFIEEQNPSAEFEAYFVGHITSYLFDECERHIASLQNFPSENQPES